MLSTQSMILENTLIPGHESVTYPLRELRNLDVYFLTSQMQCVLCFRSVVPKMAIPPPPPGGRGWNDPDGGSSLGYHWGLLNKTKGAVES